MEPTTQQQLQPAFMFGATQMHHQPTFVFGAISPTAPLPDANMTHNNILYGHGSSMDVDGGSAGAATGLSPQTSLEVAEREVESEIEGERYEDYHYYKQKHNCPDLTFMEFMAGDYECDELAETDSAEEYEYPNPEEEVQDYITDSDSEAAYAALVGGEEYPSDHDSDADASGSMEEDDWPATDVEEYNREAEMEVTAAAAAAATSSDDDDDNEGDSEQPESDPDTEVEEHGGAKSAAGCCLPMFCASRAAAAAAGGSSRTAVVAADAAALRQIRHYQATIHSLVSGDAFKQLAQEVATMPYSTVKFSERAFKALQVASEDYLTNLFSEANTIAINAGRQKVQLQDIKAARKIKRELVKKKVTKTITITEEIEV